MAKEAVFTMKLEPELRDAFMAAARRIDMPASQVARDLMRDFVVLNEYVDDAYLAFLRRKVEIARKQVAEGRTVSNEEVKARFAVKRAAGRAAQKKVARA